MPEGRRRSRKTSSCGARPHHSSPPSRTHPRTASISWSRRRPAEADPHGTDGDVRAHAHRCEHVRRLGLPAAQADPAETATPARSRSSAAPGLRSRAPRSSRCSAAAPPRDRRQSRRAQRPARPPRPPPATPQAAALVRDPLGRRCACRAEPGDAADVLGATPQPALLATAFTTPLPRW